MSWRALVAWGGLALLVVALSDVLQAEGFEAGSDLARACKEGASVEQAVEQRRCFAYLMGFLDAYRASMAVMERQAPRAQEPICLPPRGVPVGQISDLILEWLRLRPAELGESARTVVFGVLATVYPCR